MTAKSYVSLHLPPRGPVEHPPAPKVKVTAPPAPRRPYLLRTSLVRMGARRLKEDLAERREQSSQARGLGGRPGPRPLWAPNSLVCRRSL